MEPALVACHVVAFLFWLIRLIRIVIYFFKLLEIRSFYKHALRITEVCIIITSWLMYDCPLPKQVGSWLGICMAKVVGSFERDGMPSKNAASLHFWPFVHSQVHSNCTAAVFLLVLGRILSSQMIPSTTVHCSLDSDPFFHWFWYTVWPS